jgi:hypothetical protein
VRFRFRLVPSLLLLGIVLAGGASVLAAGGSSSEGSSAKEQYCPPSSPGAGQPQGGPGNNCGNPPETCPDGSPKPPPGNCGHGGPNAASEGQKPPNGSNGASNGKPKPKKPKLYVHRSPRRGCVSRTFAVKFGVANKPGRGVVTVLRDGRKLTTSRKNGFKVRINARSLRRGLHTLTFRVRGADGKLYTRTVRFTRC